MSQDVADETAVHRTLERLLEATRAKDVPGVLACYTPDVLIYDLAPPLQSSGLETMQTDLEGWFATWPGRVGLEVHDVRIVVDLQIAYCTSLQKLSGVKADGEYQELWFRSTACLQKTGDSWRIRHQHSSTPFYMDGSDKAALDLKP